ncbi:MAG: HAMP domain-containing protein, partial [Thermodesulfobacteriota bacterium]
MERTIMKARLTIRMKIFLGILAPSALLFFVIYSNYRNLSELGRSPELLLSKNYKSIRAAKRMRELLDAHLNQMIRATILEHAGTFEIVNPAEIETLLSTCKENITEEGEELIIGRLENLYHLYQASVMDISREIGEISDDQVRFRFYAPVVSLTSELIRELNDLVEINEKGMASAEIRAKQIAEKGLVYSIGVLGVVIVVTFFFGIILSRKISHPLQILAKKLSQIREGGGDFPMIPVTTEDEIGFLSREFNRLFE